MGRKFLLFLISLYFLAYFVITLLTLIFLKIAILKIQPVYRPKNTIENGRLNCYKKNQQNRT